MSGRRGQAEFIEPQSAGRPGARATLRTGGSLESRSDRRLPVFRSALPSRADWRIGVILLAAGVLAIACQPEVGAPASGPSPGRIDLEQPDQRAAYLLGLAVHRDLRILDLSDQEFEVVLTAIRDRRADRAQLELDEETQAEVRTLQMERLSARMDRNEAFLAQAAQQAGAEKLASGAVFLETKPGEGPSPTLEDSVRVGFRGTYADGEEFDSTGDLPRIFPLAQVITCWQEALVKMRAGGSAKVICPPQSYSGMELAGDMRLGETLEFDIDLVMFRKTQTGDATAPPIPGNEPSSQDPPDSPTAGTTPES